MKKWFKRLWKDESGAETAEWVVIVALLVIVGIAIYNGVLRQELSDAVQTIGDNIQAAADGTAST